MTEVMLGKRKMTPRMQIARKKVCTIGEELLNEFPMIVRTEKNEISVIPYNSEIRTFPYSIDDKIKDIFGSDIYGVISRLEHELQFSNVIAQLFHFMRLKEFTSIYVPNVCLLRSIWGDSSNLYRISSLIFTRVGSINDNFRLVLNELHDVRTTVYLNAYGVSTLRYSDEPVIEAWIGRARLMLDEDFGNISIRDYNQNADNSTLINYLLYYYHN